MAQGKINVTMPGAPSGPSGPVWDTKDEPWADKPNPWSQPTSSPNEGGRVSAPSGGGGGGGAATNDGDADDRPAG